jgi:aminopeptidase N
LAPAILSPAFFFFRGHTDCAFDAFDIEAQRHPSRRIVSSIIKYQASMRTTKNISITFPTAMAREAERLAKRENCTMSELLREAFREYSAGGRKRGTDDVASILRIIAQAQTYPFSDRELVAEDRRLMTIGAAQARKAGSKERDVVRIVHASRARRSAS